MKPIHGFTYFADAVFSKELSEELDIKSIPPNQEKIKTQVIEFQLLSTERKQHKRFGSSCLHVVMSTKISASFMYPKSSILPSSDCFKSRFVVATCPHKSSFFICWKAHPWSCFSKVAQPSSISLSKRMSWSVRSSADGGGFNSTSGSGTNGGTRLIRAIQNLQVKLNTRIQEIKKGFPMKVLFFLMGIYCATAFATVIGQTGDWDILSAGLAVVVVEAIGALMYKASFPLLNKIRSLITMFNYWKAGLSLGLFLDAFKYEIDNMLGLPNPFDFELDVFHIFL